MSDYLALTKPRITWLILMSTAIGFVFGSKAVFDWRVFLYSMLGTALIASGTAALNQWYERDADGRMNRTKGRPIPAGRLTAPQALRFGIALCAAGSVELWLAVNPLTSLLGLFTLASYLFLYTPLKQRSHHATTVGAIPGAMPPLIGYAAAAGALTTEAWILYAILFLWQFPHFYAIAWMYREDYARAGIRVEPSARRILFTALALVPISLAPRFFGMAGNAYLAGALALGLMFLYPAIRAGRDLSLARARQVLLASVAYLPLLYGLLVIDRRLT